MKPLDQKLKEIEEKAKKASKGLSFVVKESEPVSLQMHNCLDISRTDLPNVVRALRLAVEALKIIQLSTPHNDPTGMHFSRADNALKQIEQELAKDDI